MNATLHPSELLSIVSRLNVEIQDQIIASISATPGQAFVAGWKKVGDEGRLEIRSDTKMVEILSVVVPADAIDSTNLSIPLSGARLEVVGAWRIDGDGPWLRNLCFGDAGTHVLALPSFEPEHIKAAATMLAETISMYLEAQLETC